LPGSGLLPFLPLSLTRKNRSVPVEGLLDTGATVNVLPFDRLGGSLAPVEARGLIVTATVGSFPSVSLAFAWARSNSIPVILGQTNFFEQFEVCFFRARSLFEIRPKA